MTDSAAHSEIIETPDDLDRRLVLATQAGLPLHARPWHWLATELGVEPEQVMARVQAMLEDGRIRRIGVLPNHYRLGYVANGMSVWDIPDDIIDDVGRQVGQLHSVSHCYQRPRHLPDWPYNLFAMVHGHDRQEVMEEVDAIADLLGERARSHDILFSTRILKKTGLRIGG
ncbi:AsnC family transcriptional regulator [Thiogranum longum]|uniref:siroheme decarboxylase n=1 Tax=Thiogranum longum TaxID=1537524 RepID=A0A4R1HE52_9GAMM|nr:Lrp/AsnC family transcriptional regulator [Thiogranum longum]TCK17599.1 AsnC family transcriptional regulator [Thiogranum longum]